MKKFLSAAKNMIPAAIVVIVLIICAAMPELGVVPDKLTAEVNAQETSSDEDEETEETEAAVGDYEDGVYTGSATGYGGTITVQVTVEDGQITEIEVLEHSGETESFYNRAIAVIDSIILYQTWEVDAVSGATYSSNGIKNAVKNALTGEVTESETAASEGDEDALTEIEYEDPDGYIDGTYTGSAAGFGGTITASVTIEGGIITSIEIVSAPGETASYLSSAMAVIDAILAAQSPNVDAVSGATYSSNGIINAVKEALAKATASDEDENEESVSGSSDGSSEDSSGGNTDTSENYLPNYGYADGTYVGTAAGYGGDVTLSITIEGGYIVSIEVVSAEGETYAYWNQAIVLIDEIIAAQTTDGIDAVSGATYSSNGIINAVKEALAQAAASDEDVDDEDDGEDTGSEDAGDEDGESGSDSSEDSSGEDTDTSESYLPNYGYADGTYVGTAAGYGGDVTLSITIEGGYIVSIEVVSAEGETYAYWNQAIVLIDEIIAAQTTDGIDAVSGATYSSNGIINAVKEALAQAAASGDEDEDDEDDGEDTGSEDAGDGDGESGSDSEDSQEEDDDDSVDFSTLPNYGYTDGTYEGTGEGWGGDVVISVTVEGGQIVSLEVVSAEEETYAYWSQAVALLETIILAQTTDGVDAVSGATFSSEGILEAVADALAQAAASEEEEEDSGGDEDTGGAEDGGGEDAGSTEEETTSPDNQEEDAEPEDDGEEDTGDAEDGDDEDTGGAEGGGEEDTGDAEDGDDEDAGGAEDGGDADTGGEEDGSADDGDDADDTEDENTEPVTETTVTTESFEYIFTVYPDEDEDFEAYDVTVTVLVQTTVVTVTGQDTVTVTTTVEILSAEYESDTTKSNLRYFEKAWALVESLIAGEEVDAVSGATCSSDALIEIWEQIEADINPGTTETTETTETATAQLIENASYIIAEDGKNYTSTEVSIKKEEDE